MYRTSTIRIDGMVVVSLGVILFLIFNVIWDVSEVGKDGAFGSAVPSDSSGGPATVLHPPDASELGAVLSEESQAESQSQDEEQARAEADRELGDAEAFTAPYKNYRLTQGPHGFSYGHMAIDLAAGKGAQIKSPINGVVVGRYVDEYGNTTLEIENERFFVTLLHGDYSVEEGDRLEIGQNVGTESNHGYTTDMRGIPCYGREGCGYHSHLNVYDKSAGSNVNPLDLIDR